LEVFELINKNEEEETADLSANQQRWMGGIILLGGSALLASFLFQDNSQKNIPIQQITPVDKTLNLDPIHRLSPPNRSQDAAVSENQSDALPPLSVDVDTEQKLLAAQHAMREKAVAEQEARTAEFLARQEQAEANSARRVAAEQAARLEAKRARNELYSTDPAPPDVNMASNDSAQSSLAKRRQAEQDKAEQLRLRVQKLEALNDGAKETVAQAVERTAKAKMDREAAQKIKLQADKDHQAQVQKTRQEKLAKQKQDAEAQERLDAKQKKEQLQQDKLDVANAKLKRENAEKLKILEAEKAERIKLRNDKAALSDAKKAAIQAEIEKNNKEAAILQAKLDKLNATNTQSSTSDRAQKAKDAARARALLNDEPNPVPSSLVMIQVAMAASQAKADAMVAQLRAKGYKVRTSSTTKGVRVLVGPEKNAAAASATKSKIEQDQSLNVKGAWISNWQPPTS
jgi:SPOR domain